MTTKDEIIAMAREVGIPTGRVGGYDEELERFAKLVLAAEREACADICDRFSKRNMHPTDRAAAIRAITRVQGNNNGY